MLLTQRQKKMIFMLLHHDNPMHSSELIVHLAISSRTLRQDITSVNTMLKSHHLQIDSNPSKGYWIDAKDKQRFSNYLKQGREELIPTNQTQRLIAICFYLLDHDDYTSMGQLAELFYVAKTTISNALKSVQELLMHIADLDLVISNQKGISLQGSETAKRKLYTSINLLFYETEKDFMDQYIVVLYDGLQCSAQIKKALMDHFVNQQIYLTDKSLHILTNELLFSVYRFKQKEKMIEHTSTHETQLLPFAQLEEIIQVAFSGDEKTYACSLVKKKRTYTTTKEYQDDLSKQYKQIVDEFYSEVVKVYHLDFSKETKLTEHIYVMLSYHDSTLSTDAFHLQGIKDAHPFAFAVASCIEPIIHAFTNKKVTESELCSLTARISVILDQQPSPIRVWLLTDLSTSLTDLLVTQIEQYFGHILRVVGVAPFYKVATMGSFDGSELFLGTSQENIKLDKEILTINAVLSYEDIEKIINYIQRQMPSYCGIKKTSHEVS